MVLTYIIDVHVNINITDNNALSSLGISANKHIEVSNERTFYYSSCKVPLFLRGMKEYITDTVR